MSMDFNLKQHWRDQQHESKDQQQQQQQQQQQYAKLPRKMLIDSPQNQQQQEAVAVAALPLFVSDAYSDHSSTPTSSIPTSSTFSRVEGRNNFSMAQWQELEVQAVIYRHMVAGAAIPPELLYLVKKSLLTSPSSPYYLHHYPPHFHSAALMQAGYWGKGAMDAEPGRCRRTDGKKWRCSRDVVAGHKYCERHVHRGRHRSRKPVEFPTSGGSGGLESLSKPAAAAAAAAFTSGSVGGAAPHFGSGASTFDAFQLHTGRSAEFRSDKNSLFSTQHDSTSVDDKSNNKVLMHFFDDHPKTNANNLSSSTSLSMSTPIPENSTSDFLRLSTGNAEELGRRDGSETGEQEGGRVSWTGTWGGNSMGGPLAEAFRSSSNSSPTGGYQCSTPVA
ncbi:hypothetical protein RND81_04G123400 [Saponaria officinalis]|uniref:Growth-regulating factor n=1 Tax=Saponaria officinalis TaxID=3572 RepID=A0AAW1LL80_SAPOF